MALILSGDTGVPASGMPAGSVIQVQSVNWNTVLNYSASDGTGQTLTTGWSVIPTNNFVNLTTKVANSKLMLTIDGNMAPGNGNNYSDWIGGWGFVVDPAGGTNWTRVGSGQNSANTTNVKFFSSRAGTYQTNPGTDPYWIMPVCGNYLYSPSVAAGTTVRAAIEYFHYRNATTHANLLINNNYSNSGSVNTGNETYHGAFATTLTVMEIAP